jgi:hypothetical protein
MAPDQSAKSGIEIGRLNPVLLFVAIGRMLPLPQVPDAIVNIQWDTVLTSMMVPPGTGDSSITKVICKA